LGRLAVWDFDRDVNRHRARLGVKEQRQADHPRQHQYAGPDQALARTPAQGFDGGRRGWGVGTAAA
jgi:hypothetical protein